MKGIHITVFEISNIKNSVFVGDKDLPGKADPDGWTIGTAVKLKKRITVPFDQKKELRHDIPKGFCTHIKGWETKTGKPVIQVSATVHDEHKVADVAIDKKNLVRVGEEEDENKGTEENTEEDAPLAAIPGYPYIRPSTAGEKIEVINDWQSRDVRDDAEYAMRQLHFRLGFVLANVGRQCPEFTDQDITLIKRGEDTYEAYAARDFRAHEIRLALLISNCTYTNEKL